MFKFARKNKVKNSLCIDTKLYTFSFLKKCNKK